MSKRMITKDKRFYPYLLSFFLPVLSMLLIFIAGRIYPFGENTFLRTDMYHQYAPFFSEFRHKLWGLFQGRSLFYTWDVGLGMNFWALYAYYLASPLNWFVFLVPKSLVIEFMSYMIIVKIGLCGVTMCWFLRHRYPLQQKDDPLPAVLFSVFYAMSGYISAYSWNIMWLDCIILFPLIILGAVQLMEGKSPFLYTICLGLSVLSNYYISIMICLFLIIYFFCLNIIEPWPENRSHFSVFLDRGIRFFLFSLLGGMLAAVTLIPEIYAMQLTASVNSKFPETANQYFTIIDMFARQMPFVETEQGLDHWPNIYAGAMVFLLLPLYFLRDSIPLKKKIANALLLLFFFLSFSMNILNFIWHGMHYPNSLPCRQSFIYIFLLLVMCYEVYLHRNDCTTMELNISFGVAMGFLLIAQKTVTDDAIPFGAYYLTMAIVILYYFMMMEEKRLKTIQRDGILDRSLLSILLVSFVFLETTANMAWTSVKTTSRTAYVDDNDDVRNLVARAQNTDSDFYRFEKITRKTKDDGAWMNFPSVSLFSSTAYEECSKFFKLIGCESSTNAYSITGSTPLVNMLFGVKYDLYSEQPDAAEERGLMELANKNMTWLYRTKYALPLGYMMTEAQLSNWYMDIGTPALVQNSFADAMDADPIMINTLGTFRDDEYVVNVDQAGEYYAYVNPSVTEVTAECGFRSKSFKNVDRGYLLELGYIPAGQEITIRSDAKNQKIDCDVYRFDYKALNQIYDKLKVGGLKVESFTDTNVKGTIHAEEEGIMVTSIPYDEGWSVYVDGRKTEYQKVKKCFLGVPLTAGDHIIELRYMPQGLLPGTMITLGSLLILIAYALYRKKHPMHELGAFWDDFGHGMEEDEDFEDLDDVPLEIEDLETDSMSQDSENADAPASSTPKFDEDGDLSDEYIEELIEALEKNFDAEEEDSVEEQKQM